MDQNSMDWYWYDNGVVKKVLKCFDTSTYTAMNYSTTRGKSVIAWLKSVEDLPYFCNHHSKSRKKGHHRHFGQPLQKAHWREGLFYPMLSGGWYSRLNYILVSFHLIQMQDIALMSILKRVPKLKDVEDLLCGSSDDLLPKDPSLIKKKSYWTRSSDISQPS